MYTTTTTTTRPVYYVPNNYYSTTTYRPIYPSIPTHYSYGNQHEYNSHTRYTPVSNPQSLTQLASEVQRQLDSNLNDLLDETRRTHFSSSQAASLVNTDVLLDKLRNELKTNISYNLDEVIRQNYGNQRLKDGYLYSVGPQGEISSDYNYGVRDLESMREQMERNLINKLNNDFEQTRKRLVFYNYYCYSGFVNN